MKTDFLKYQAQTSTHPLGLEISHANGSYVYDTNNKEYLDFIAGVSANSLGHNHPVIKNAILVQLEKYTHVMVYGEFVQKPQVELCKYLSKHLPSELQSVYLTNSGTEATEGALKLAKRYTGRSEIIAAKNAYHGNTQGAMSICGNEQQNSAYRPLIPGAKFISFNSENDIQHITNRTAAVILETIQGGAGFIVPINDYLLKVKKRCNDVGALLILDEIQTGIGRTGKLFGFENYHVAPDILIVGKGLGGGMPIGAFIASTEMMAVFKKNPALGHITTFGGHPLIAASALATCKEIVDSNLIEEASDKEKLFRKLLRHDAIKEIRGKGLMLAIIMESPGIASKVILKALENGLLLFWLLYEDNAIRITPPLNISNDEIKKGCSILLNVISKATS
ncbi:MAG: aminotransferase class III-fold pyridoxal phosphate-dependent enzyme [Aureibaculum sp.]|nr:aminotransferase class III-fold pyridoxal phosphate-dependent enzyme [Aureibaculum sp.]